MNKYCIDCNKSISRRAKRCNRCNRKGRIVSEETKQKLRIINLGKKISEETRRKISKANMGHSVSKETVRKIFETRKKNNSWKHTEETKKKLSDGHKKRYAEGKMKNYWEGKKLPKEMRDKISKAHMGKVLSEETKKKMLGRVPWNKGKEGWTKDFENAGFQQGNQIQLGKKHHNWQGGKIDNNRGKEWQVIRKIVLDKYDYTCLHCGSKGDLDVHHIIPYREVPEHKMENLISLCKSCHVKADRKYSKK